MKIGSKRCYTCGDVIPETTVMGRAVQCGYEITQVSRLCRNGHRQACEVLE